MIKLRTPLVIGTVLIVTVLGAIRLILVPESWASSLAALVFFPCVFGILTIRPPSRADDSSGKKVSGKLRASLVGAGVLLASSLFLSITDNIELTGQSDSEGGRTLFVMIGALIAVAADLLSARLEKKAEEEP